MLLQTNSYIVPPEKRAEHARLMRRFRQVLNKVGCDSFEVYEQVAANWSSGPTTGRFVQIMRFRDRKHQMAVQSAERTDPVAQQLIAEFCELINYPYQQDQRQFAVGFYSSAIPVAPARGASHEAEEEVPAPQTEQAAQSAEHVLAEEASQVNAETPADEPAPAISDHQPQQPEPEMTGDEPIDQQLAAEPSGSEQETPSDVPPDPETVAPSHPELADAEMSAEFEEMLTDTTLESTQDDPLAEPAEETAGEESQPAELSAGEEDLLADAPFDEDEALFAGDPAEHPAADYHGKEAHEPAPAPTQAVVAHPQQPRFEEAALEDELQIDDDDISRLAEELASGDDEAHDPRHPGAGGQGRASGNGAH